MNGETHVLEGSFNSTPRTKRAGLLLAKPKPKQQHHKHKALTNKQTNRKRKTNKTATALTDHVFIHVVLEVPWAKTPPPKKTKNNNNNNQPTKEPQARWPVARS